MNSDLANVVGARWDDKFAAKEVPEVSESTDEQGEEDVHVEEEKPVTREEPAILYESSNVQK